MDEVSHNTKLLCFELPTGVHMRVPVGCHVHMKRNVEGNYTCASLQTRAAITVGTLKANENGNGNVGK